MKFKPKYKVGDVKAFVRPTKGVHGIWKNYGEVDKYSGCLCLGIVGYYTDLGNYIFVKSKPIGSILDRPGIEVVPAVFVAKCVSVWNGESLWDYVEREDNDEIQT